MIKGRSIRELIFGQSDVYIYQLQLLNLGSRDQNLNLDITRLT